MMKWRLNRESKRKYLAMNKKQLLEHMPLGNCINAKYHYCHKGCTVKKYEIHTDYYDRETDSTQVTIGNKTYDCVKVKLNGKCIFNSYDDEEEHKNGN